MHIFKNGHAQKIQKCQFPGERKTPEAQRETQPEAFKNSGIYIYICLSIYNIIYYTYTYTCIYIYINIYTVYIYIYIILYTQTSNTYLSMKSPFFTEISKSDFFPIFSFLYRFSIS